MVMASHAVVVGDLGDEGRFNTEDYFRGSKDSMPLPVRWMPPEVLAIASKDPQSWWVPLDGTPMRKVLTKEADMWAFGVTMWEVLTFASLPFGGLSDSKFISAMKKSPPQLGGHEHLPPACGGDLLNWCMSRTPSERPSIASALNELRACQQALVGTRQPGSPLGSSSPMMNRALPSIHKGKGRAIPALPAAPSGNSGAAGAAVDLNADAYEYMDAARAAALKAKASPSSPLRAPPRQGGEAAPVVASRPALDGTSAPTMMVMEDAYIGLGEAKMLNLTGAGNEPLAAYNMARHSPSFGSPQSPRRGAASPDAPPPPVVPPRKSLATTLDDPPPLPSSPLASPGLPRRYVDFRPTGLGAPQPKAGSGGGPPQQFFPPAALSPLVEDDQTVEDKTATLMMTDNFLEMMVQHMDSPVGMDPDLFQNAAALEATRLRTDSGDSDMSAPMGIPRAYSAGNVLSEGEGTSGTDGTTDNDSGPGTPDVNSRSFDRRRKRRLEKKLKDACRKGYFDKMCALVATPGLNIDATRARGSGRTALYCASEAGDQRIVAKLIEAEADPFKQTRDGLTPLHIAEKKGFADVAELLRSYMDKLRPGDTGLANAALPLAVEPTEESAEGHPPPPPVMTTAQLLAPAPSSPAAQRAVGLRSPPSPMMARSIAEEGPPPVDRREKPSSSPLAPHRAQLSVAEDMYVEVVNAAEAAAVTGTPGAAVQRRGLRPVGLKKGGNGHLSVHEVAMQSIKGAPPSYQTSPLYEVPVRTNPDYMSSQEAHDAIQRQIMGAAAPGADSGMYVIPDLGTKTRRTQADVDNASGDDDDDDDDMYGVVMTSPQPVDRRSNGEAVATTVINPAADVENEYLPLEGLGGKLLEATDAVEPGDVAEVLFPAGARDVTDEGTVIPSLQIDDNDISDDEDLRMRNAPSERKNSVC